MCSVCRQNPCHPACPNAPDPEPVHTCLRCDYGIFPGDKFYETDDGYICEECLDDMTTSELMELFGEELQTA